MTVNWIETRPVAVAELTRYPGNAKRGDVAAIRESIKRHGQYRAIVVRKHARKMTILAGNHTYDALIEEGAEQIRCEIISCSDQEATRINLADNRLAELGTYDDEDLATLLASLDGDFAGTGWNPDEFEKMNDSGLPEEGDAPIDDLPVTWGVIIECDDEDQQVELLQRFDQDGLRVRALM